MLCFTLFNYLARLCEILTATTVMIPVDHGLKRRVLALKNLVVTEAEIALVTALNAVTTSLALAVETVVVLDGVVVVIAQ